LSGSLPGRRARVRLLAAAAVVALLAACGEGHSGDRSATPPRDAVAVVNGQAITRSDFERFVESAAGADETASGDRDARRRLFVRMIDEELLIQRAIALGLHRRDPAARRAILSAIIALVASAADAGEPDEAALRRYYEQDAERFSGPEQFAVDVVRVSDRGRTDAEARGEAEKIAEHLRAGEGVKAVLASYPNASALATAAPPLPLESLARRAGPSVARAVSQLQPGEVSGPVRDEAGYTVVALRERHPAGAASFDELRGEVRSAYLRQRREQALRDTLHALRRDADVRVLDPELVAPSAPSP
jgi:peptidyl-prolyl cis-trans isomerase C